MADAGTFIANISADTEAPPRVMSRLEDVATTTTRTRAIERVVERHVLPRLLLRMPAVVRPQRFGTELSDEVSTLTDLALQGDSARSQRVLRRLHAGGARFGDLQIGLLAPAARRLDGMWLEDEVSFFDVTLATGSLQQMMRFVALDLAGADRKSFSGRSILVAPAPGETHVFGAAMAAEFFRRDGWNVVFESRATQADLVERVRGAWFDVIGLSISAKPDAPAVKTTLAAVREGSKNRSLLVIAGGEAISANPRLLGAIGADAALAAIEVAPARAHRLVNALFGGRN